MNPTQPIRTQPGCCIELPFQTAKSSSNQGQVPSSNVASCNPQQMQGYEKFLSNRPMRGIEQGKK